MRSLLASTLLCCALVALLSGCQAPSGTESELECPDPLPEGWCEERLSCCTIFGAESDHTNPPIILRKGSLVWKKQVRGPNPTLPVGATEIFSGGACANPRVLNFAMIGHGTFWLDARTRSGTQIKNWMDHPFVFEGTDDSKNYRLEIQLGPAVNTYTFFEDDTPCVLQARDPDHKRFVEVAKEFGYLDELVTWNGNPVDLDHKLIFQTYDQ